VDSSLPIVVFTKQTFASSEEKETIINSKYFLASIVESSQDSIVTIDFDGIVTTWNKAAEDLYGYPASRAIGSDLMTLVFPENLGEVMGNIENVKHSQRVEVFDSVRLHRGGREIMLEVVMSPVKNDEGQVIGVSTIARDVTERRLAQDLLQQAHDELETRVEQRTQELRDEVMQRRDLEAQRTQLMQRVVNIQEEERGRVSRELHDNLGQHLTAILLGIEALQAQSVELPSGERRSAISGLGRLYEMINDLTGIAHRLAWELRPAALDNIGLEAALQQYLSQWLSQNGVTQGVSADFISHLGDNDSGLTGEAKTALYRVTQEALTNVLRHAKASRVSVVLERKKDLVMVIVEDDGQGFDAEEAGKKNRLGVLGMRERLELVGGTLEVESEPGSGTTVYARVALKSSGSHEHQ
jgi:PAS domain S-box-containing protein